jgi:hypothetical protein
LTKLLDSAVFLSTGHLRDVGHKQTERPDILLFFSQLTTFGGNKKKQKEKQKKTFTNTDQPSGQKDWAVLWSEIDEKFGLRLVGYDVCAHRQLGGCLSLHHHNRRENITIRTFVKFFRK